MGLGPLHPGREGREGWGGRVGKGRGRKGRGGRGNKHTRFKTCGAAHAVCTCLSVSMHAFQREKLFTTDRKKDTLKRLKKKSEEGN